VPQSLITPQAGDDYTEGVITFHPVRQEANARLVNTSYKINLVTFFLLHKASVKIQGTAAQAQVHLYNTYNNQNCSIHGKQTTETIKRGAKIVSAQNLAIMLLGCHLRGAGTQQQQPTRLEMTQKYISSSEVMALWFALSHKCHPRRSHPPKWRRAPLECVP
jgi:hypothetical protein